MMALLRLTAAIRQICSQFPLRVLTESPPLLPLGAINIHATFGKDVSGG